MDTIKLYSNRVELSENSEKPDVYIAKFIICDFGVNKNGVGLNRSTIENWIATLVNKPIVGKITVRPNGELDFSGHNAKIVKRVDEGGDEYEDLEFDTSAFGTFTSFAIEDIEGVECITATAEIWKRFTRACNIIQRRIADGGLATSWEISVIDSEKKVIAGKPAKIINDGRFLAHCLLAKDVLPAYDSSGLLEVASLEGDDTELVSALSQDCLEISSDIDNLRKEDETLPNKENVVEVAVEITEPDETTATETEVTNLDETTETTESAEATVDETPAAVEPKGEPEATEIVSEQATLTDCDLRNKINDACRAKLDQWCWIFMHLPLEKTVWVEAADRVSELDFIMFTYEINSAEEIVLSEPTDCKLAVSLSEINNVVSEKNEALISANSQIETLTKELNELSEIKKQYDEIQAEEAKKKFDAKTEEIKKYVENSECFTAEEIESEEISTLILNHDEATLKCMIADKIVIKLTKNKSTETSETKGEMSVKADIVNDEVIVDAKSVMKAFLSKK